MHRREKSYGLAKAAFVLGCIFSFGLLASPVMAHDRSLRFAEEDTTVMVVVEVSPQFEGNMNQWLSENLKYPEEAYTNQIEGRVFVSFVIEKDGSVSHAHVVRSAHPLLDTEALRVISDMPKWKPAMSEGQTVRFGQTLPITFKMAVQEEAVMTFEEYLQNLKTEQVLLDGDSKLSEEEFSQRVETLKAQLGDDATVYKMLLDKSQSIKNGVDSLVQLQTPLLKLKKSEVKQLKQIYENEINAKISLIGVLGQDDFIRKFVEAEQKMRKLEMEKVLEIQKLLKDRFKLYFENFVLQR